MQHRSESDGSPQFVLCGYAPAYVMAQFLHHLELCNIAPVSQLRVGHATKFVSLASIKNLVDCIGEWRFAAMPAREPAEERAAPHVQVLFHYASASGHQDGPGGGFRQCVVFSRHFFLSQKKKGTL